MNFRLGISDRMNRALRVIQGVYLPEAMADREAVTVEAYANCREQGLSVWVISNDPFAKLGGMRIAVSENRNSDDIMLCWGPSQDFQTAGNIPDDDSYENRRSYFPSEPAASVALKSLIMCYHETGDIPVTLPLNVYG